MCDVTVIKEVNIMKNAIKKIITDNHDKDFVIIVQTKKAIDIIYNLLSELSADKMATILSDTYTGKMTKHSNPYGCTFVFSRSNGKDHIFTYCSTITSVDFWKRWFKNILIIDKYDNIDSLGYIGVSDLKGEFNIQIDNDTRQWVCRYAYTKSTTDSHNQNGINKHVSDIKTYCEGSECDKRDTCNLHNPNMNRNMTYDYHDFSKEGSGSCDSSGHNVIKHRCGRLGEYKLYDPARYSGVPIDTEPCKHTEIPKIKIKPVGMGDSKFKCTECGGGNFVYSLDDNDCLIIRCCWCDVCTKIELPENSSILKYKRYKTLWNSLKKCINIKRKNDSNNGKIIKLEDIRKHEYENWNHYKYEDFNRCPYCNHLLTMTGQVNDIQFFTCYSCSKKFVLNVMTEKFEMDD